MFSLRLAALLALATPLAWSFMPSVQEDVTKSFEIEVQSTGVEPRQLLRFTPQAEDEAELSMAMTQTQEITVDGRKVPIPAAPALRMTMVTKTEAVNEEGLATQSWKDIAVEIVGDAEPNMRKQLESIFEGLEDFSGSLTFDSRGFVHESAFEIPEDGNPMLKQILKGFERSMSEIVLPFPEEPVGLGAAWTVGSDIEMNGVSMRSVSSVELVALDANGATFKIKNEVGADAQSIENDQIPPGASLELLSCGGEGSGETKIEFRHYHPVRSTVDSVVDMEMKTTRSGSSQTMAFKITMDIEAERHALETAK